MSICCELPSRRGRGTFDAFQSRCRLPGAYRGAGTSLRLLVQLKMSHSSRLHVLQGIAHRGCSARASAINAEDFAGLLILHLLAFIVRSPIIHTSWLLPCCATWPDPNLLANRATLRVVPPRHGLVDHCEFRPALRFGMIPDTPLCNCNAQHGKYSGLNSPAPRFLRLAGPMISVLLSDPFAGGVALVEIPIFARTGSRALPPVPVQNQGDSAAANVRIEFLRKTVGNALRLRGSSSAIPECGDYRPGGDGCTFPVGPHCPRSTATLGRPERRRRPG